MLSGMGREYELSGFKHLVWGWDGKLYSHCDIFTCVQMKLGVGLTENFLSFSMSCFLPSKYK